MIEKFEMRYFFGAGMIIFFIVGVCNIINMYFAWQQIWITSKITGSAMIFFYFMLSLVFYKQFQASRIPVPEIEDNELDEVIEESENE